MSDERGLSRWQRIMKRYPDGRFPFPKQVGDHLPIITTVAEMLDLLRADPVRRAVCHEIHFRRDFIAVHSVSVVDSAFRELEVLAWIDAESHAEGLCQAAAKAAKTGRIEEWGKLPIRLVRFLPAYVLPESPHAPESFDCGMPVDYVPTPADRAVIKANFNRRR